MIEELATALATHQLRKLKRAWRRNQPVLKGKAPSQGEVDIDEMYTLLNTWTVLDEAQKLALKRVPKAKSIEDVAVVDGIEVNEEEEDGVPADVMYI